MNIFFAILFLFATVTCYSADYTADADCDIGWVFDAGAETTVEDETSNNRDGTFRGDGEPAWSAVSPPTNYTAYVDYDDSNDYISAADDAALDYIQNGDDFTIYMCTDFSVDDEYSRFMTKQEGTSGDGWSIVRNSTYLGFLKEAGGTQKGGELYSIPSAGTWHNVFIQYDASEVKARVYVDKAEAPNGYVGITSDWGFGWASDGKLYLGGRDNASSSVGSKFAAYAIWSRLLSDADMDDICDNGLGAGAEPEPEVASAGVPQIIICE